MFANWLKEETTTTGTGTVTLTAVTGFPRFSDFFADSQHVSYCILDSDGNPIEAGIGKYTATNTLARTNVLWTYSAGTLTTASATAVTLAAGTKTVIATPIAGTFAGTLHGMVTANNKYITSPHHQISSGDTNVIDSNTAFYMPFYMTSGMEVDAFVFNVTTAAAGNVRCALYEVNRDGSGGAKVVESADIDTSTTGVKTGTFTRRFLPAGWYYIAIGSKGISPTVRANTGGGAGGALKTNPMGISGFDNAFIFATETLTGGWTDLPAAPTLGGYTSINADFAPRIALRAA